MKSFRFLWAVALLAATPIVFSNCQNTAPAPAAVPTVPNTPVTSIPDALVGTWYEENNPGPMTTNWAQNTFQSSQGFAEYRTLVLTKDGKNAVDYTSEVFNGSGGEVEQRMYKLTGTLAYDASSIPSKLTFHAQSGTMRVFSNKYAGYKESPIAAADVAAYQVSWSQPEATTFAASQNFLTAKRVSGGLLIATKYKQVAGTGLANPNVGNGLYDTPPAAGTYVKIGNQYFPTVTIGNHIWMAVNYVGSGGINDATRPKFGTYYRFLDLSNVQVPAGWRIPTKQDYVALLASQGLTLDMWDSTDPSDIPSKRKLGQLMASGAWTKQDGYATNSSGFTALPSDYRTVNGVGNGIGTNLRLWTAEKDAYDSPLGFQLFQLPVDTYASIIGYPLTTIPVYMPVRLVRDK